MMIERKTIDSFKKNAARRMRLNATGAEAGLWKSLRRHPMMGSHFRRQVVIGPYIADFACMAAKLIVEVDGSQHGEEGNVVRDQTRTKWFETEGYKVLRFWNNDVTQNIDGVLATIHDALSISAGAELVALKHLRHRKNSVTPPRRAPRADPPPPGEGEGTRARRPSPSKGG